MNVSGALAQGMYHGEPDFESLARLLVEAVRTLPALATASGEPDEDAEIPFGRTRAGARGASSRRRGRHQRLQTQSTRSLAC
jgi:hypothetical protein